MTAPVPLYTPSTAEQSTLGAMLINPEAIITACAVIGDDPEVFVDTAHQLIYSAMLDLYRDGEPVDMVTVCGRLTERGEIQDAGGMSYITGLVDGVPTSANVAHYARRVADAAQRRLLTARLRRASLELQHNKPTAEVVQELLDFARESNSSQLVATNLLQWRELAAEPIDSVFYEGLPVSKLGVLSAEGGTGKSFLALELAIAVALGHDVLRTGFTPTQPGRVLCCFGEDDDHVVAQRLAAISETLKIDQRKIHAALVDRQLEFINAQTAPLLHVDSAGHIARTPAFLSLHDRAMREAYRLVIIDPLVSWAGIPNENDNAAMQHVAAAFIAIAEASQGAVLVLHHANKNGTRAADLSQSTTRGASSLLCAARWVASMRTLAKKDAERYGIAEDDAHEYCEVFVSKNSYAPRNGQITTLHRGAGGVLRPVDLREDKVDRIAMSLPAALGDGGLTRREMVRGSGSLAIEFRDRLAAECGFKPSREWIDEAITAALNSNLITVKLGPARGAGAPRKEVFPSEF